MDKILAIIPARCGSKGFPHKNVALLSGQTLLELAIRVGLDCRIVDDVYVSTDCSRYEEIALKTGARSLGLRAEKFSGDKAKSVDVVIDMMYQLNRQYDYVVLLQPTSPIRQPQDIEKMISLLEAHHADACVSVYRVEEPHPYKMKKINSEGYVESFLEGTTSEVPRQSLPEAYALNGAIYIVKTEILLSENTFLPGKTIPYLMDTYINIDTESDFICLEAMYERKKIKIWGLEDA